MMFLPYAFEYSLLEHVFRYILEFGFSYIYILDRRLVYFLSITILHLYFWIWFMFSRDYSLVSH